MKKAIALTLVLVLCLALAACGSSNSSSSEAPAAEAPATEAPAAEAPAAEPAAPTAAYPSSDTTFVVPAKAGGGMVEAVVSGERRVLSVTIDPEVCDPEDTEMLGDLVAAAVNAALEAANADYESEMGKITGGMDLGGLM